MGSSVYNMYLPIYQTPSVYLKEFVATFSSNPSYLMQIVSTHNILNCFPSYGDSRTYSIQLNFFIKSFTRYEYDRLSHFCSKFNTLSSIASMTAPEDVTFTLEICDSSDTDMFKDAVKVLVTHFEIKDISGIRNNLADILF